MSRNRKYARTAAYRKQWGPTLEEERRRAQDQMLDEGADPNSMSNQDWRVAREERVKANRRPMVYDQARGRLVPKDSGTASSPTAEDYWAQNPESSRTAVVSDWSNDPEVARAQASGDSSAVEKAVKAARDRARTNSAVAETNSTTPTGAVVATGRPALQPARAEIDLMDLVDGANQARDKSKPDMAKFRSRQKERESSIYDSRLKAEAASRDRFAKFLVARDQEAAQAADAEGYLKAFRDRARASKAARTQAVASGRPLPEEFWEADADLQATMRMLSGKSREERLAWAKAQMKGVREERGNQDKLAREQNRILEEMNAAQSSLSGMVRTLFNNR